ncbi:hypothetical protein [Mesorhizobium sp. M0036]|uniref:hypothetical protein n=1 Tax=Mesorhizobium sp. M0036 TaxID=2956853 RepID=UPI0033375297
MALLAAQPAEKGTHQRLRVETIGIGAAVLARHRNARGMDDVDLGVVRPQPARQPDAVAARLIGDDDPLDRVAGPAGFVAPALQKLQECWRVGIELLEGLTLETRNKRRNQPFRLAHLMTATIVLSCSRAVRDRLGSNKCDMGRLLLMLVFTAPKNATPSPPAP